MLTVCSTTHEDVITVNGKLNGKNAKCLIDSGASGNLLIVHLSVMPILIYFELVKSVRKMLN